MAYSTKKDLTISYENRIGLTIPEFALVLGVGLATARKVANEAEANVYVGSRRFVNVEKVQKYINAISE